MAPTPSQSQETRQTGTTPFVIKGAPAKRGEVARPLMGILDMYIKTAAAFQNQFTCR